MANSVMWLFLMVPLVDQQYVIGLHPDHTHLLFYPVGHSSVNVLRPEFFYKLINNPSYCNFPESRKKMKFNF